MKNDETCVPGPIYSTVMVNNTAVPFYIHPSAQDPYGSMSQGWGCGYVLLKKDHPLFGKDYYQVEANTNQELTCCYKDTYAGETVWVMGWDTSHFYNNSSHDQSYVQKETEQLAVILYSATS